MRLINQQLRCLNITFNLIIILFQGASEKGACGMKYIVNFLKHHSFIEALPILKHIRFYQVYLLLIIVP